MRQKTKEITDRQVIIDLMSSSHVGRLATIGHDGYPHIKPLNFVHLNNRIYFHSAGAGEKIDDILRDNRVAFEVDLPIAMVTSGDSPCRAEYLYRSIVAKGRAVIVDDESERLDALKLLMVKYQPAGGYAHFLEEKVAITTVVRIDLEEVVGKEDLGKEDVREQALKALSERVPLPIIIKG